VVRRSRQVEETLTIGDGATSTTVRQFVYGGYLDDVLQMNVSDGSTTDSYYYMSNTLYSVHGITNSVGDLIEAYEYDPYGSLTMLTDGNDPDSIVNFNSNDTRTTLTALATFPSPIGNTRTYTGKAFDAVTEIYYSSERYYNPIMGRWLSPDPAEDGINLYEYVHSLPTGLTDPFGLASWNPWVWIFGDEQDPDWLEIEQGKGVFLAWSNKYDCRVEHLKALHKAGYDITDLDGDFVSMIKVGGATEIARLGTFRKEMQEVAANMAQAAAVVAVVITVAGEEAIMTVATAGSGTVIRLVGRGGKVLFLGSKARFVNWLAKKKALREKVVIGSRIVCFTAGTLVQTVDGPVAIEEITSGTIVYALSFIDNQSTTDHSVIENNKNSASISLRDLDIVLSRVTNTFVNKTDTLIDLIIVDESGKEFGISGTPEHPFFVPAVNDYVEMKMLKPATILKTSDGALVKVKSSSVRYGEFSVYNFEVEGTHNYYVSSSDGGPMINVHNRCNWKSLSKGEIKKLKKARIDPHSLKPKKHGSRYVLFKDENGNISVFPKNGKGPGDPTGININDL